MRAHNALSRNLGELTSAYSRGAVTLSIAENMIVSNVHDVFLDLPYKDAMQRLKGATRVILEHAEEAKSKSGIFNRKAKKEAEIQIFLANAMTHVVAEYYEIETGERFPKFNFT